MHKIIKFLKYNPLFLSVYFKSTGPGVKEDCLVLILLLYVWLLKGTQTEDNSIVRRPCLIFHLHVLP